METPTMTTDPTNLDKFIQVYADAVISHDLPEAEWRACMEVGYKMRELSWKGKRMPLAAAATHYAHIVGGYNEFVPDMLTKLAEAFVGRGIDATPARESSVCVYLWIPDDGTPLAKQVKQFIRDNWIADEVDDQDDGSLRIWWD